jgi:hypothetical protein
MGAQGAVWNYPAAMNPETLPVSLTKGIALRLVRRKPYKHFQAPPDEIATYS